jgi:glycosyltransferase involved in cell wall biosynthesis
VDKIVSNLPLVSVIIPAYNAEVFIARTLQSVISQTYKNLQILVVDDGSQDKTAEIVESFLKQDSRVILLQQPNAGVALARNLGIAESSGEFIAPIDADDIWYPQKIEKQVECFLKSEENVGLVYNLSVWIDEEDRIIGKYEPNYYLNYFNVEGNAYPALLYTNIVGNGSVPLIRRTCFEKIGGYNHKLKQQNAQGCEDWDIYLRIAEFYEYRVVPEFLVGYRQVKCSMSKVTKSMAKSFELVILDARQRRPEFPSEIYDWAACSFRVFLSSNEINYGNYWNGLYWLYQAIKQDSAILLRRYIYRCIAICIVNILAKPVTSLIWDNHESWLEFKNKLKLAINRVDTTITIDEINKEMRDSQTQEIVTHKLYEKLTWQRWLKILHYCKTTPLLTSSKQQDLAYLSSLKKRVN